MGADQEDTPFQWWRAWRRHTASLILPLFAFRHYGYQHFPQDQWGDLYGLGGALCLLAAVSLLHVWWPLKAWIMGEELLTAGCTAAFLAWPEWFVHAFPDERCSQAVGFKIGSVGLMCLALIVHRVNLHTCAGDRRQEGNRK